MAFPMFPWWNPWWNPSPPLGSLVGPGPGPGRRVHWDASVHRPPSRSYSSGSHDSGSAQGEEKPMVCPGEKRLEFLGSSTHLLYLYSSSRFLCLFPKWIHKRNLLIDSNFFSEMDGGMIWCPVSSEIIFPCRWVFSTMWGTSENFWMLKHMFHMMCFRQNSEFLIF